MNQLSLLDYVLTPEEATESEVEAIAPVSPLAQYAIAYHEAKAAYLLKLMTRFMTGTRCSLQVRQAEITRLHQMRQQELEQIEELSNGRGI